MKETPKKRGRPRAFDDAVVLRRATETFLEHGYAGASLEALTTAMGVNKPSLYAAFGDKRRLFFRVLEELVTERGRRLHVAFQRGDTLESALRATFLEAVDIYLDASTPPGCLVVSGSVTEALVDPGLAEFTREFFALSDRVVAKWIGGYLPEPTDVSALVLSRLVNGVIHDLALRARVGESPTKLREHARDAARAIAKAAG